MLWSGLHRKKIVLGTAAMSNVKLIGPPHSTLWSWLLPSTVGADFLQPWLWLSHYLIVWLYVIKISCTLSFYKSFDFGTAKKPFPGREEFGNFVMNILFFNTRRLQQIIWNDWEQKSTSQFYHWSISIPTWWKLWYLIHIYFEM